MLQFSLPPSSERHTPQPGLEGTLSAEALGELFRNPSGLGL